MTVVVISNLTAARARRHVPALRDALPQPGVVHHLTEQAAEMEAVIGHHTWSSDDLLIINGGDGTVQHALTVLMQRSAPGRWPRLACLPGGTTNMTAYDLNRHRRFGDCLPALRAAVTGGVPEIRRRAVTVEARGRSADHRCGFFFGIGTIVQGIEYFHERLRSSAAHELGAGAALARTLWGIARRQPPFSRSLTVRFGALLHARDGRPCFGPPGVACVRLFLATTLDRLFLGIRPYWGPGPGSLKSTLVESRAPGFVARVPRLLRGRPDRNMTPQEGYHSARLDALTLSFNGTYTLDGELFHHAGDTMAVTATDPLRVMSL